MTSTLAVPFVIALLLTLWQLHAFGSYQHPCLKCGDRGAHRNDCPLRKGDE